MPKSIAKKPRLIIVGEDQLFHFKHAAARREAIRLFPDAALRDAGAITIMVREGKIPANLVRPVKHRSATTVYQEKTPRTPSKPVSIPMLLGRPRTRSEFADLARDLAQVNPRGFRQPSAKEHRRGSTSLVELAAIAAGEMEPHKPTYSARGMKKLAAKEELKAAIRKERAEGIDPKYLSAHARRRLTAQQLPIAAE